MKITSFSFTVRVAKGKDGYSDNYYVDIDEDGVTKVSHPYKSVPHKEQAAILGIIQSGIIKYGIIVNECDKANRALKLEEYAPTTSPEVTTTGADFDLDANSAVPQPARGASSTEIADIPMESAKDDEEKLQAMLASGLKEEYKEVEEKSLAKTIEENVIESLGLK